MSGRKRKRMEKERASVGDNNTVCVDVYERILLFPTEEALRDLVFCDLILMTHAA